MPTLLPRCLQSALGPCRSPRSSRWLGLSNRVVLALLAAGTLASARGDVLAIAAAPATDVCGDVSGATWTAAGSPYVTTCDLRVAAGAALTIEAGTRVQLGANHAIAVAGRLAVQGTNDAPVRFEPASGSPWAGVQLAAGSGPHRIAHAAFVGGGARRTGMLDIASSDTVVEHGHFSDSAGSGIDVKGDASPAIRASAFVGAAAQDAQPSAALRLMGTGAPLVEGNRFESNDQFALFANPSGRPRIVANRFAFNANDGGVTYGTVTGEGRLPSLGERRVTWLLRGTGISVAPSATLTIDSGATVRIATGIGIQVNGALRVMGEAGREVHFTSENPASRLPGQWTEIKFNPSSQDFDPVTGSGSRVEHAILEFGGFNFDGALSIADSSPRIMATTLRDNGNRGMTVSGAGARPQLIGLALERNGTADAGVGLMIRASAAPDVSFSTFRDHWAGIHTERDAVPRITPFNRFVGNASFAVRNLDLGGCVQATANDWGSASGPLDGSLRTDDCGLGEWAGEGQPVSDGVQYLPFQGQLAAPYLTGPRCGTTASGQPVVTGFAPTGSTVVLYDNYVEWARVEPAPSTEPWAPFTTTAAAALPPGSHVLAARAERGDEGSALGDAVPLNVEPDALIRAEGVLMRQSLEGTDYVQPYQDGSGCALLAGDGSWQIQAHPGAPIQIEVPLACPDGAPPTAALRYGSADHPMQVLEGGAFGATVPLGEGGAATVVAQCGDVVREVSLGTVSVALNGFVHIATEEGGVGARVAGATVTLFRFDPSINNFRQWSGAAWFGQQNPQVTGTTGWYGFYPPPGRYLARVEAPGFVSALTPAVEVRDEPFMVNVGLTRTGGGFVTVGRVHLPLAWR